ncbi:hypothetical protein PQI66_04755 [Corynebacterium sp. USCH3]|uniref:hypothetical protein n=1 Tax=Corynebacterium sp. USCH3 TaxID=3024840 RepID=UPI0030A7E705
MAVLLVAGCSSGGEDPPAPSFERQVETTVAGTADESGDADPTAPAPVEPPVDTATATATEDAGRPAGIDGDYTETDELVSGTTCGAASGNTLVEVREGAVSCLDAQAVVDEYHARRDSEGGGNTLSMTVGEWNCSTPTAGRSAQLQAAEICYGPDDVVIATPAGSVQP